MNNTPWVVKDFFPDHPNGLAVIDDQGRGWHSKEFNIQEGGLEVASIRYMSHHSHYATKTIEEAKQCACLLSQARELLAVLKECAELMNHDGFGGQFEKDEAPLLDKAFAVIAKAEGRA